MDKIIKLSEIMFPNPNPDTLVRRKEFLEYLLMILPTDLPVQYSHSNTRGDGNCFFRALFRYLGYLTINNLPNKDWNELNPEETIFYTNTLNEFKIMVTDYIRNFIGDPNFILDPNTPEYDLICDFITNTFDLRIIILEYDRFQPSRLNRVLHFVPTNNNIADTIILINFNHHFSLLFPTSLDKNLDTKNIRTLVSDNIIKLAKINEKIF